MNRGFTLAEMMISLVLSLLVLSGASGLYTSLVRAHQRQNATVELEQTLRIASQVIARALRGAGNGLGGGTLQLYNGTVNRNCPPDFSHTQTSCYYPVQFSNSNGYPTDNLDANARGMTPTYTDSNTSDGDTDPDWLRVVALDNTSPERAAPKAAAVTSLGEGSAPIGPCTIGVGLCVIDNRGFSVNQPFYFVSTKAGFLGACARELTSSPEPAPTLTAAAGMLPHSLAGLLNLNPATENCLDKTGPVYHAERSALFRVDTGGAAPRLMMSQRRPGTDPTGSWQLLAENIEDLQFALIMLDGTVCNSTDAITVAGCTNPTKVRSVRFTLVARAPAPAPGLPSYTLPMIEDRPAQLYSDGYVRRSLTTQVELRNNGNTKP